MGTTLLCHQRNCWDRSMHCQGTDPPSGFCSTTSYIGHPAPVQLQDQWRQLPARGVCRQWQAVNHRKNQQEAEAWNFWSIRLPAQCTSPHITGCFRIINSRQNFKLCMRLGLLLPWKARAIFLRWESSAVSSSEKGIATGQGKEAVFFIWGWAGTTWDVCQSKPTHQLPAAAARPCLQGSGDTQPSLAWRSTLSTCANSPRFCSPCQVKSTVVIHSNLSFCRILPVFHLFRPKPQAGFFLCSSPANWAVLNSSVPSRNDCALLVHSGTLMKNKPSQGAGPSQPFPCASFLHTDSNHLCFWLLCQDEISCCPQTW